MKRINMAKYGFVRWPEEDFSDDGNRFTCYRVGKRVRVSKLVTDTYAFIDARIDGTKLPFEVYSALPHYIATGELNGVPRAGLTDQDLLNLYNACIEYEKEYELAENEITLPSIEDIRKQCEKVQAKLRKELEDIKQLLAEKVFLVVGHAYDWRTLGDNLSYFVKQINSFDPEVYPLNIFGTAYSLTFCDDSKCQPLQTNWYYKYIKEMFDKY